jgi:hypothetical protein
MPPPNYYLARQRLEYAQQELDGDGEPSERLTRAWLHLSSLARGDVPVPPSISEEVAQMHATVETWILPRQSNALGTAVAWMDDAERQAAIDAIERWRHVIDEDIAAQHHRHER